MNTYLEWRKPRYSNRHMHHISVIYDLPFVGLHILIITMMLIDLCMQVDLYKSSATIEVNWLINLQMKMV